MHFDLTSKCHVKSVIIRHYFQIYSQNKIQLKNAVLVDRNSISLPFKISHLILHLSITPNFNLLQYVFIIFPISLVLPPLSYTFHKPITFQYCLQKAGVLRVNLDFDFVSILFSETFSEQHPLSRIFESLNCGIFYFGEINSICLHYIFWTGFNPRISKHAASTAAVASQRRILLQFT